jgi:hypothetical protein
MTAHLTHANQRLANSPIQRIRKILGLSNDVVNEIGLATKSLEEEVAVGGIHVRFNIYLGEVGLVEDQ